MSLPCSKPSSSFLSIILGIKPKLLAMANNSLNGLVPSSFSSPICLKDPTGYHIVSQISQVLLLAYAVCSAWNAFHPSFPLLTPFHSSGLSLPVTWGSPRLWTSHFRWVGGACTSISPLPLQEVLGLVGEIHSSLIVSLPVRMTDTPPPPTPGSDC